MGPRECASCHYSHELPGSNWVECRRYPPTNSSSSTSGFPTAQRTAWCGEYLEAVVVRRNKKRDEQWV